MEIRFKNFVCYPCPTEIARDRFDMYWDKRVRYTAGDKAVKDGKAKIGQLHDVRELVGYGMRLDECMNKGIKYLLQDSDRVIELKEYINEYKQLQKEITDLIKH